MTARYWTHLLFIWLCTVSPGSPAETQTIWQLAETARSRKASGALPVQKQQPDTWKLNLAPSLAGFRPGSIRVPLPDGHMASGILRPVRRTASGGRSYQITFAKPGTGLSLHVGLNATYGQLRTTDSGFVIEPGPNGSTLMRLPERKLPKRDLVKQVKQSAGPKARRGPLATNHTGELDDTLDFLYLYDESMIEEYGWGFADQAVQDIADMQFALLVSRVPLEVNLAQLQFMDVPKSYMTEPLLDDAYHRRSFFVDLQEQIDALDVDIISLNRVRSGARDGGLCGIAYVYSPEEHHAGRVHINVCQNDLTLAHETGHNLGLGHGLETDRSTGLPVDWAQGFRLDDDNHGLPHFTSIMSYSDDPPPHYFFLFSDPTVLCDDRSPCGRPVTSSGGGADAAEALRTWGRGPATRGRPLQQLASSVLPSSRFVPRGERATAFLAVINPNQVDGLSCAPAHHGPERESFTFQVTDPDTNKLVGSRDQPVTIPAGELRTFIISITPSSNLENIIFAPYVSCRNIPMTTPVQGLNTLNLGADAGGGPDLITLAATPDDTGVVNVPAGGAGYFAVAVSNIGGPGRAVASTASLDPNLPASARICPTLPGTIDCITPLSASATLDIPQGGTPTFLVEVRTEEVTPCDASRRFQFQLHVDGQLRGSTSVAVCDQGQLQPPVVRDHRIETRAGVGEVAILSLDSLTSGYYDRFEIVSPPTRGEIQSLLGSIELYTYVWTGPLTGGTDSFTFRAGNPGTWSRAAAIQVTAAPLPLPGVGSFRLTDDAGGTFRVDLDEYADESIEIDRFVLTTPPSADYDFNPETGIVELYLPEVPGNPLTFSFRGENRRGQGNIATGTVDLVPYNSCAPDNDSWTRWLRRLEDFTLSLDGRLSVAEVKRIGRHLCLTDIPERNGEGEDYVVYFLPPSAEGVRTHTFETDIYSGAYRFRLWDLAEQTYVRESWMCKMRNHGTLQRAIFLDYCTAGLPP